MIKISETEEKASLTGEHLLLNIGPDQSACGDATLRRFPNLGGPMRQLANPLT